MKKKIIITGGAGFIGLNLITLIDTKKYDVTVIDKNQNNLNFIKKINSDVKIVAADLKEVNENWVKYFKGADCVIQLQTQITSPHKEDYTANNVSSVENVLKACKKYKIKNLIHVSTAGVISVAKDNYSITKTLGEKLVRESSIPSTVLRPPMLYGCFEIKHLGFLAKKLDSLPILPFPGTGKYIRQPLYAKDFCRIIIKLIETTPKREVHNIIGKEQIYFIDLIKAIVKEKAQKRFLLTLPIPIFLFLFKTYTSLTRKEPYQESQLTALTAGDIFPVDNWEEKFGVKYTPFKEGVKDYASPLHQQYAQGALK